jgi:XRE family aerobic/anaerobic benzoate catabolism transcriptional regulator
MSGHIYGDGMALPMSRVAAGPQSSSNGVRVSESDHLRLLGDRVRQARARRGMSRKVLAADSGVSERYLAQLEKGQGNISILLLRRIGQALDLPLEVLVLEGPEPPIDLVHALELLRRLPTEELRRARCVLLEQFGGIDCASRHGRIALIGLRGAGKSTLGAMLAERLQVPFIELDRLIEEQAGVSLSVIFDLRGQSGFRRLERQCLEQVLERYPRFVLATSGSLVSEPATYERLLASCATVWLRASAPEHMARVLSQGDTRPMAGYPEALGDLERIMAARETLYRRADEIVDTSRSSVQESFELLTTKLRAASSTAHV